MEGATTSRQSSIDRERERERVVCLFVWERAAPSRPDCHNSFRAPQASRCKKSVGRGSENLYICVFRVPHSTIGSTMF